MTTELSKTTPRQSNHRIAILETIKSEMTAHIANAKLSNLDDVQDSISELFRYAHYLNEVRNETEPDEQTFMTDRYEDQENTGILVQKLAHGFINTPDGKQIFVPESILRQFGFRHGDIMEYRLKPESTSKNPQYEYARVESSKNPEHTKRRTFTQAVLENDAGKLVIMKNKHGLKLMNTIDRMKYIPSKADVETFKLKEKDIVDIAWYDNSFERTARIIWKY